MEQDNTQALLSASPYIQRIQGEDTAAGKIYIVHSASGDSERIFAVTASDALSKTTMENPTRVIQYNPLNQVLVAGAELNFDDDASDSETGDSEASGAAAEGTPPAKASAEQAPAATEETTPQTAQESAPPPNA